VESIGSIAVTSCGLKRHLQILVVRYVRYRCWVLIYLALAPSDDERKESWSLPDLTLLLSSSSLTMCVRACVRVYILTRSNCL